MPSERDPIVDAYQIAIEKIELDGPVNPVPATPAAGCQLLGYIYDRPLSQQWCITHNQPHDRCDPASPEPVASMPADKCVKCGCEKFVRLGKYRDFCPEHNCKCEFLVPDAINYMNLPEGVKIDD